MATTLSEWLGRFVVDLNLTDLLAPVIDKAKACLLHFIGVGFAGGSELGSVVGAGNG
jgi:hypothetical protein